MTEQDTFIAAAREAAGELSLREIARRLDLSNGAVIGGRFNVPNAVERWNANPTHPPLRYVPARVEVDREE